MHDRCIQISYFDAEEMIPSFSVCTLLCQYLKNNPDFNNLSINLTTSFRYKPNAVVVIVRIATSLISAEQAEVNLNR